VLGDVSGKGLKAAMTVSSSSARCVRWSRRPATPRWSDRPQPPSGRRLRNGFVTAGAAAGGRWNVRDRQRRPPSPFLNDRELELPRSCRWASCATWRMRPRLCSLASATALRSIRRPAGGAQPLRRTLRVRAGAGVDRDAADAHAASEVAVAFGQDATSRADRHAACDGVESTTHLVAPELVSAN